ncbi:MAG TPA: FGGY-family carbohydrate kinase [Caulobacteraceae bacterium]
MTELLLALDVGTTSLGAGLFSPGGELKAFASSRLASYAPAPGLLEQDADQIWRAARRTIAKVLDEAGRTAADLAAIGVTSQRTSVVVWGRHTGKALSPLVIWSDLRGANRARQLRETGHMVAPQQAAAKLEAVVAETDLPPDRLAWGNVDSWLIFKLSGGAVHATDASQAWPNGYLDLMSLGWNAGLIELQGLTGLRFPDLVDTWGVMGVTARSVLGAEVPIAADVADQQAALIAHGGQAGDAKVTYGTSATLDVATGVELVFKSMLAPPFIQSSVGGETRFCLEGMVYSAGSALDWLRTTAGLGGHVRFEALAASVADGGGAWFLPALQGLGAPYGDAARRGALGGLTLATTPAHIARAALEGLAFRVREVFDFLYGLSGGQPPEALGVDGGLTANETFLQVQADLLGRPIRRHAVREATACGAAICAGLGVGLITPADAAAFTRYDKTFAPRISGDEADARLAAWKVQAYGTS